MHYKSNFQEANRLNYVSTKSHYKNLVKQKKKITMLVKFNSDLQVQKILKSSGRLSDSASRRNLINSDLTFKPGIISTNQCIPK